MAIIVEKWTARRSNTLYGFADVVLERSRLKIRDCAIHEKGGRRWVSLPARPMIDRDGAVLRDEQGKTRYAPILEFTDREASDEFARACIAAVLAHSPAAFDDAEG